MTAQEEQIAYLQNIRVFSKLANVKPHLVVNGVTYEPTDDQLVFMIEELKRGLDNTK